MRRGEAWCVRGGWDWDPTMTRHKMGLGCDMKKLFGLAVISLLVNKDRVVKTNLKRLI